MSISRRKKADLPVNLTIGLTFEWWWFDVPSDGFKLLLTRWPDVKGKLWGDEDEDDIDDDDEEEEVNDDNDDEDGKLYKGGTLDDESMMKLDEFVFESIDDWSELGTVNCNECDLENVKATNKSVTIVTISIVIIAINPLDE